MQPWLKENPQADFAELERVFGTPESIAAAYLDEMPQEEILTKLSDKRKVVAAVAAALALALVIWATVLIATAVNLQKATDNDMIYVSVRDGEVVDFP